MAPRPTYDAPHVQLGLLMVAARRRGLDFDTWWWEAVREGRPLVMTNHPNPPEGCVRWPTDRSDRHAWQAAIHSTREGWRRVFDRCEPTPAERAVGVLGDSIGVLERVAAERAHDEMVDALPAHAAVASAA